MKISLYFTHNIKYKNLHINITQKKMYVKPQLNLVHSENDFLQCTHSDINAEMY